MAGAARKPSQAVSSPGMDVPCCTVGNVVLPVRGSGAAMFALLVKCAAGSPCLSWGYNYGSYAFAKEVKCLLSGIWVMTVHWKDGDGTRRFTELPETRSTEDLERSLDVSAPCIQKTTSSLEKGRDRKRGRERGRVKEERALCDWVSEWLEGDVSSLLLVNCQLFEKAVEKNMPL